MKHFYIIESPEVEIDVYDRIQNIRQIKIVRVSYRTQSAGERYLIINIKGYQQNVGLINGQTQKYTGVIFLPNTNNTLALFEHTDNGKEYISKTGDMEISTLHMSFLVNNNIANISALNPLYIELEFL